MDRFWFYTFLIIGIGLALLVGWFGMCALFTYWHNKKAVQASQVWQEGKAWVTRSTVEVKPYVDEERLSASYMPRVQYIYQVDNRVYQGQRIGFGEPIYTRLKKVEAILAKYPWGCEVNVFYDPLDPEDAVLERACFIPMAYLILGIVFASLMVLILSLMTYGYIFHTQAVLNFFSV